MSTKPLPPFQPNENDLDPEDWQTFREQGHRMFDDMVDFLAGVRERPVWQPMPAPLRDELRTAMPRAPGDLAQTYGDFQRLVQPYIAGNIHPRFMGWVHGGG
ncbi:MAG TPA: cytochrome D ubiquinol oxidase subunit I, partial [Janthinobacterium sp.]|nr:cytochrome D ubiquinol oxidase subunit I [Janthinobacterium sp.]